MLLDGTEETGRLRHRSRRDIVHIAKVFYPEPVAVENHMRCRKIKRHVVHKARPGGSRLVKFVKVDIGSKHQVLLGIAPMFLDQVVERLRIPVIGHAQALAARRLEKAAIAADSVGTARVGRHVHLDLPCGIVAARFRILGKIQVAGARVQGKEAIEPTRKRRKRYGKQRNC